jgi:hypothetical protein
LNQIKNPPKLETATETAYSNVIALFMTAIMANMRKARPPKQPVMRDVSLKVIGS